MPAVATDSIQSEAPAYLKRFRCLGPECEDTCCQAWRISVDRDTYARYQAAEPRQLKNLIRLNVLPQPPARATDREFASIALAPNGACPFLTSEKLCHLQNTLGDDGLSNVCARYPRVSLALDGRWQRGAVLSCPEAARLALLDATALDAVQEMKPASTRPPLIEITPSTFDARNPIHHTIALRDRSVGLMRRTDVSLEARLLALGLALRKLHDQGQFDRRTLDDIFDTYEAPLAALDNQLAGMAPQHSIQIELLRELLVERFAAGSNVRYLRYAVLVDQMAQALKIGRDVLAGERAADAYSAAFRDVYLPYMEQHPWLLGNFLLNYLYTTPFPVSPGRSLFDEYILLVVGYALVKLHLVGAAAYHGELTDERVVETVYLFSRAVEHDQQYLARALDLLRAKGADSMGFMTILIVS